MDLSIDVFKTIDRIMNRKQNNCPFVKNANEILVSKDIVYRESDAKVCKLDAYVIPKDEGLYPVVFYIHGGGFVAGGKKYRRGVANWYASNGFFVVNVDHGLCPDYKFPQPVIHLADALNWVVDHAQELRLDLDKLIVAGDSAGAYYAALLAVTAYNKKLQSLFEVKPKTTFKAAVLNCGLYDIQAVLKKKYITLIDKKVFSNFTGVEINKFDKYKYKEACIPANFVTKKFPPTFLIYAQKDMFCGGQAERLIEIFKENDVYFERVFSSSVTSNHCYCLNWKDGDAVLANTLTMDFLQRFLNGKIKR